MGRNAKFSSKQIAEYCRDNTVSDAMIAFNCSRSTVTNACMAHGVTQLSKPAMFRRQIAQWVKDNNASISEATLNFQTSRNRVGQACKENGIVPRSEVNDYDPPVSRSNFEILLLLMQGYSQADIAREFGISRQRVEQIQKRAIEAKILGKDAVIVWSLKEPQKKGKRNE